MVQPGESLRRLAMTMMTAPLGVEFPVEGIMVRHHAFVAWGSQGEDLVLLDMRRRRSSVVTLLQASYLEPCRLC
jgi:hypothetical protein